MADALLERALRAMMARSCDEWLKNKATARRSWNAARLWQGPTSSPCGRAAATAELSSANRTPGGIHTLLGWKRERRGSARCAGADDGSSGAVSTTRACWGTAGVYTTAGVSAACDLGGQQS